MSYLYIEDPNVKTYISDGNIVCENSKENLKNIIPIELIDGVMLVGNTNISSGMMKEMLIREIPVTFLSNNGGYYGRLESTKFTNVERQRNQFKISEDEKFKLEFAIKIISAKINNQIVILRRYNRYLINDIVSKNIKDIEINSKNLNCCQSINQVMGIEGICARKYFESLALLVNKDFKFNGRNRNPPKDEFNSLLSFGYTLLLYEIYTIITTKGLNPYVGLMHKDRNGHPSLASDLMEEWRAIVVDSLNMYLINSGSITINEFEKSYNNGIIISKEAVKKYIKRFNQKMLTKSSYLDYVDEKIDYRRALELQVGCLIRSIELNNIDLYNPIRLR